MIVSVSYGNGRKPLGKIIKESNHILGLENETAKVVEYKGMMISYGKYAMRINTLLNEDADISFLSDIINRVFQGKSVGISGLKDKRLLSEIEGTNVYWV